MRSPPPSGPGSQGLSAGETGKDRGPNPRPRRSALDSLTITIVVGSRGVRLLESLTHLCLRRGTEPGIADGSTWTEEASVGALRPPSLPANALGLLTEAVSHARALGPARGTSPANVF